MALLTPRPWRAFEDVQRHARGNHRGGRQLRPVFRLGPPSATDERPPEPGVGRLQEMSPASPVTLTWQTAVEGFFLLVALFVLGYFLWESAGGSLPLAGRASHCTVLHCMATPAVWSGSAYVDAMDLSLSVA